MSKTPFEVRLDVMKMAQDMLDAEFRAKENKHRQKAEALAINNVGGLAAHNDAYPTSYTESELLSKASALYGFVNDSSGSRRVK